MLNHLLRISSLLTVCFGLVAAGCRLPWSANLKSDFEQPCVVAAVGTESNSSSPCLARQETTVRQPR
jgi:hypothetical protein